MQWISLSRYMGKCIYLISSCTVVPPAGLLICSRLFHFFKIKVIYCTSLGSFFAARARLFCRESSQRCGAGAWRFSRCPAGGRGRFPAVPSPCRRRAGPAGLGSQSCCGGGSATPAAGLLWGVVAGREWFPARLQLPPSPRAGLGCPCDTKRVIPDPRALLLCRVPCALLLCSAHTPHSEWLIVAEVFPSSVVLCCQQLELCKDQKDRLGCV